VLCTLGLFLFPAHYIAAHFSSLQVNSPVTNRTGSAIKLLQGSKKH